MEKVLVFCVPYRIITPAREGGVYPILKEVVSCVFSCEV